MSSSHDTLFHVDTEKNFLCSLREGKLFKNGYTRFLLMYKKKKTNIPYPLYEIGKENIYL